MNGPGVTRFQEMVAGAVSRARGRAGELRWSRDRIGRACAAFNVAESEDELRHLAGVCRDTAKRMREAAAS